MYKCQLIMIWQDNGEIIIYVWDILNIVLLVKRILNSLFMFHLKYPQNQQIVSYVICERVYIIVWYVKKVLCNHCVCDQNKYCIYCDNQYLRESRNTYVRVPKRKYTFII